MNPLDIYVRESLFAGDDAEKVERINASYTMPRLPKTKREYMDYMCAWRLIISNTFDVIRMRDIAENKFNCRDFLQYIVDFHFANLPAFHIDPNESSRVYKEFAQSRYKSFGRPGSTKAITWYDLKYDDQIVANGQASTPIDLVVFKTPEHPVNPWIHRTEVMNLVICSDRNGKLNSDVYQVILRRTDCIQYLGKSKWAIYDDGRELTSKEYAKIHKDIYGWCDALMDVWKQTPDYKRMIDMIKGLFPASY